MSYVLKVHETELPAAWASALVNNDYSGLGDADIAACLVKVSQLASINAMVVSLAYDPATNEPYEPRFTWAYELYGGTAKGGEVTKFVVHQMTKVE